MGGWTGIGKDRMNWDGVLSINGEPVKNNDLVTKFYTDANDFWQRVGTILSPKTAGDSVEGGIGSKFGTATTYWEFGTEDIGGIDSPILKPTDATGDYAIGTMQGGINLIPSVGGYNQVTLYNSAKDKYYIMASDPNNDYGHGAGTFVMTDFGTLNSKIWTDSDIESTGDITTIGSIATGTLTITASADNTNVSGVNTMFIDTSSGDVVVGGFSGGVAGQHLYIALTDWTNNVTLEHAEGEGTQDIIMHQATDETLTAEPGGWTLICDGSDWYDCSHARQV